MRRCRYHRLSLSCVILAALCMVPMVFCFTAELTHIISVLGHVALVVALFPVAIAMQDWGSSASYASLANIAELVVRNTMTGFWLMAACMLLPLCVLDHVAFFSNDPSDGSLSRAARFSETRGLSLQRSVGPDL